MIIQILNKDIKNNTKWRNSLRRFREFKRNIAVSKIFHKDNWHQSNVLSFTKTTKMSFLVLNLKSLTKLTLQRMIQSDFAVGSALFLGGIVASASLIAVCPSNLLKNAVENDKTQTYVCCRP